MRSRIRFAALTLSFSAVLYLIVWVAGRRVPLPWNLGYLPGVLAVMLAAQGFPWRRRIAYAAGALVLFAAFDAFAIAVGLQRASDLGNSDLAPVPYLAAHLVYHVASLALPLLALVFYVRRRPSVLWTAEGAPASSGRR